MTLLQSDMFFHRIGPANPDSTDPFAGLEDEEARPQWPDLSDLGLTRRQLEKRRSGLGGSDANILMSGNRDAILSLWREKRGEQAPPDLSTQLPVALGQWTEAFNRHWFERIDGRKVSAAGVELICPTHKWRRCTLDGIVIDAGAVWEAKHTNAFAKPDEILERYMPQLQHNMAVAGTDRALLSVIFGNLKFQIFEINSDWSYQIDLLAAEQDFWNCVLTGDDPVPSPVPEPPKAMGVREICLEGNNAWADAAFNWLEHRQAAKSHALAVTAIKSLVEDDVARAFGHGIEAKRSKSGAVSIRELAS